MYISTPINYFQLKTNKPYIPNHSIKSNKLLLNYKKKKKKKKELDL